MGFLYRWRFSDDLLDTFTERKKSSYEGFDADAAVSQSLNRAQMNWVCLDADASDLIVHFQAQAFAKLHRCGHRA